jgi:hypothetical protein
MQVIEVGLRDVDAERLDFFGHAADRTQASGQALT